MPLGNSRCESQRDSGPKPSCRVGEATLGSTSQSLPTPTGLQHPIVIGDATPLGLKRFSLSFPKVARASQPWAGGRNPVGIGRKVFGLLSVEKRVWASSCSATCRGAVLLEVLLALALFVAAAAIITASMNASLEGLDRRTEAAREYRAALSQWEHADPRQVPFLNAVRLGLGRVTGTG